MSDELQSLREEVARLRTEVEGLKAQVGRPRNEGPDDPGHYVSADHVRTERVYVSERKGGPFVEINAEGDRAGIYLRTGDGKCRGKLEIGPAGVVLEVFSEERKTAVGLSAPGGHGQVFVASPDGVGRAVMRSTKLGGTVNVLQASGQPGVYLLAQPDGGKLEVISKNARSAVSAYADETGCGVVRVHESSGETMACLAASALSGVMTTFGQLGEEAVIVCGTEQGGMVVVCDADGEMKATFPSPGP